MSAMPKRDGPWPVQRTISKPPSDRNKKKFSPLRPAQAYLQPVIECMARMKAERGRCVFVFTAPNRQTGTSYVVKLLAEELVTQFQSNVAIVPTAALKGCDPKNLPKGFTEQAANLWTAVPDETLDHMPDFALENLWISPGVHGFDYVLVDCPSLESSPTALRWAAEADGVILVVRAGVTRIEKIEAAQRLLQTSTGRLKGMVLNQRTYSIPNFLYKFL